MVFSFVFVQMLNLGDKRVPGDTILPSKSIFYSEIIHLHLTTSPHWPVATMNLIETFWWLNKLNKLKLRWLN